MVRDASKVKDVDDVEWESGAKRLSKARFQSLYGLPSVSLTAFVTNDDSVKEGVLVEENDGVYTFRYKLDNVVSVYYLKYQMRTYSGSKGFPVFDENDGIVMTVKMDGDRKVSSISTVCSYKVDMLGGVRRKAGRGLLRRGKRPVNPRKKLFRALPHGKHNRHTRRGNRFRSAYGHLYAAD